jgi:hypothetical protein
MLSTPQRLIFRQLFFVCGNPIFDDSLADQISQEGGDPDSNY